jgi:hypothetical protein
MKLAEFKQISKPLYAELEAVYAKYGLKVAKISTGVEETVGSVRITTQLADANLKDAAGNGTTPELERWKQYAGMYGLNPEWAGQTITMSGRRYTVAGLRNTSGAKCVCLKRDDGKVFVTTAEDVKLRLASKQVGSAA